MWNAMHTCCFSFTLIHSDIEIPSRTYVPQNIPRHESIPHSSRNEELEDFVIKGLSLHNTATSLVSNYSDTDPHETMEHNDSGRSDHDSPISFGETTAGTCSIDTACDEQETRQPCVDKTWLRNDELKHLLPFVKRAAPEIYGHYPTVELEPLLDKKAGLHR